MSLVLRGNFATAFVLACVALTATSCTPAGPTVAVTDSDPIAKVPAIEKAVRDKDVSVVPQLVKDLESDDPAVRFYADYGLRELTGQDFGYKYYQDVDQRRRAVDRWKQWLAARECSTPSSPAAQRPVSATAPSSGGLTSDRSPQR